MDMGPIEQAATSIGPSQSMTMAVFMQSKSDNVVVVGFSTLAIISIYSAPLNSD